MRYNLSKIVDMKGRGQLPSDNLTVGKRVRALRLARGWSYRQLALKAHVSHGTIPAIESEASQPTMTTLEKLADALEVSVAELVGSSDAEHGLSLARPDPKQAEAISLFTQLDDAAQDDILRIMERMADPPRKRRKSG